MKIIVGLGNPGKQYQATRHNVGFDVLRILAEKYSAETPKAKFESLVAEVMIGTEKVLLVWPQTYMNRSGLAVQHATSFYKLETDDLLVLCDDFHLAVGRIRLRAKGSAGGQNGLKDIAQQLGTEAYARLRIGVGPLPDGRNAADFVLGRFAAKELEVVDLALHDSAAAATCWVSQGMTEAMNQFNGINN